MMILGALLLVSLGCPPLAAAAGRQPRDYEAWIKLGKDQLLDGKDAQAQAAFTKALAFPSQDYRAVAGLAQVDEDLGRWGEAAEFYERALKKSPHNYALCMKLAHAYVQLGRLDLAKKTFTRAKSIDPKQANTYIVEGYADLDAGENAQAKEQFESVIGLDTSSPYGYDHLASYYSNRGDWASAERLLRRTLELLGARPRTPRHLFDVLQAKHNLAFVLIGQGRRDEAAAILREALREPGAKSETHIIILETLGSLYASQGKRAEAEAVFKQASALCEPEASCTPRMPLKSSRRHWVTEVRVGPFIYLGNLYADEGRKELAEEEADKAWNSLPAAELLGSNELAYLIAIGELYFQIGDDAKAEHIFRLAVVQLGKMPPATTSGGSNSAAPSRSSALSQLGRIPPLETSGETNSLATLGSAEAHLAVICKKSGRYEEASRLYRDAIRIERLQGRPTARFELQLVRTRIRAWLSRLIP